MSHTIEQLRDATDEQLIAEHDELATHTTIGTSDYLDELRRRDQARAMESSHRLAVASFVLAIVNSVVAVAAVVIAVLA